jgi:hypothetical protein
MMSFNLFFIDTSRPSNAVEWMRIPDRPVVTPSSDDQRTGQRLAFLAYSFDNLMSISRSPRRFWQTSASRRLYYGQHDAHWSASS